MPRIRPVHVSRRLGRFLLANERPVVPRHAGQIAIASRKRLGLAAAPPGTASHTLAVSLHDHPGAVSQSARVKG